MGFKSGLKELINKYLCGSYKFETSFVLFCTAISSRSAVLLDKTPGTILKFRHSNITNDANVQEQLVNNFRF
jgi:hypothetical protein